MRKDFRETKFYLRKLKFKRQVHPLISGFIIVSKAGSGMSFMPNLVLSEDVLRRKL